jgi:hypothetical protein
MQRRRLAPARLALATALAILAMPLGGCTSSTYCGVPVLEFLFCDPRGDSPSYGSFDTAQPPEARFVVAPSPPLAGQEAVFSSTSRDPDGFLPGIQSIFRSEWDLDGDGTFETRSEPDWTARGFREEVRHTYPSPGPRTVQLAVYDWDGLRGVTSVRVEVAAGPGEQGSESPPGRAAQRATPPHAFLAQLSLERITGPRGSRARARRRGTVTGVRVRGRLAGSVLPDSPPTGPPLLPPPRALSALLASPVVARLDISTNRARTRQRIRGVAVATFAGRPRGRVCFALRIVNRRGRQPAGSFRILRGTGAGARLRGSGRVRASLRAPDVVSFGGTVRTVSAQRAPLPAPCRRALR